MPLDLKRDLPGALRFWGSADAELYTREVAESYRGLLELSYVSESDGDLPAGFLHTSPPGQYWSGTMWTRDAGAFLRELVLWGNYEHASLTCQCLIDLVQKSRSGFCTFAEYYRGQQSRSPFEIGDDHTYPPPTSASDELDGTTSIIIAMVLLWQALPPQHRCRDGLYDFLHHEASPLRGLHAELEQAPLLAGDGEFGGGSVRGLFCSVAQNNLAMLALSAAARMEEAAGDEHTAALYRADAELIRSNMVKHLVDEDGSWIWAVAPETLTPATEVITSFGGTSQFNGVTGMYADALGLRPLDSGWEGVAIGLRTFEKHYSDPRRKDQFDRYGLWLQDDVHDQSSAAYGFGYAAQTMLLFDRLEMADKALSWMAKATYEAEAMGVLFDTFEAGRLSPYYFYERYPSPVAEGERLNWVAGCGPLCLVNVAEPLKVARLIMGVDDTCLGGTEIIPRVPPSWQGAEATNWPIRTSVGVVRADITFEKQGEREARFAIQVRGGESIPKLSVRLPSEGGTSWHRGTDVASLAT